MSLHPNITHWFQTYVPREQTVYALEALAATGQVELETDLVSQPLLDNQDLRDTIQQAQRLTERYRQLLPAARVSNHLFAVSLKDTANKSLGDLRQWLARHLRLQRRLHASENEWHNLDLLRQCFDVMGDSAANVVGFGHDSRFLCKQIYACPLNGETGVPEDPSGVMETYVGDEHLFHVALCLPEHRETYDRACRLSHGEKVELPDWLVAHWAQRDDRLEQRLDELWVQMVSIQRLFEEHLDDPRLANALNDLAILKWYLEHSVTLTEDHRYCYVTGWTTAENPEVLQLALERASIDAKILFRPAPRGDPPPVSTGLNGLVSPFRLFVNLFGTPGPDDLDPTPLLKVIVPILFGFMFPDVGHGLLLAVIGWVLSSRFPLMRFLVPCGLVAAGFGVLFGEAFGSHEWLQAILFQPLDDPLSVLLISLGLGAVIILLGLALSGIGAYWRGAFRQWLWLDGAVLTLYASGLAGLFYPPAFVVSMLALLWYFAGLLITSTPRVWHGVGRLLHSALELFLNTLSFSRIGAFALAHAALSNALLELVAAIEAPALQIILLLLGHALIIVIEGLVVFVQTTRLVLFEFFSRFLRVDGRLFRPLESPGARP